MAWGKNAKRAESSNGEYPSGGIDALRALTTLIGKDATLEGDLSFTGNLRLDGHVSGNVEASGALVIGPSGCVQGNIDVAELIVLGRVVGRIHAKKKVELKAGASVEGEIHGAALVTEAGASLKATLLVGPNHAAETMAASSSGSLPAVRATSPTALAAAAAQRRPSSGGGPAESVRQPTAQGHESPTSEDKS